EMACRARRPCWPQQCVAMNDARGCSECGLDAFAQDEPAAHVFIRPKPDDTSSHRAEGLRLRPVDRSTPDPARFCRDRVGEACEHARRGAAFPRAIRMKTQAAEIRHVLESDAASVWWLAREIGFARGACDIDTLPPDPFGSLEFVCRVRVMLAFARELHHLRTRATGGAGRVGQPVDRVDKRAPCVCASASMSLSRAWSTSARHSLRLKPGAEM